jgi:hypothetical protein
MRENDTEKPTDASWIETQGENGKGVSGEGVRSPPVKMIGQDNEINQHSNESNETDEQEVKDEKSITKNYRRLVEGRTQSGRNVDKAARADV